MAKILLANILELVDFVCMKGHSKPILAFYNLARVNFEPCLNSRNA